MEFLSGPLLSNRELYPAQFVQRRLSSSPVLLLRMGILAILLGLALSTSHTAVAQDGTWSLKSNIPEGRRYHGVGVVNDIVYVVGGQNDLGDQSKDRVDAYDPATDIWTTKQAMPDRRGRHAVGVIEGILYAAGGVNAGNSIVGSLFAYDPVTDTWSTKAAMPNGGRAFITGAVIDGKLYVPGGLDQVGPSLVRVPTLEAYNPLTNSWETKTPMLTARQGAMAAAVDGILYVIGGDLGGPALSVVEAYNPITDSWTTKSPIPTARSSGAVAVLNGLIYVIGGSGGAGAAGRVEAYDPATDAWTTVSSLPGGQGGGVAAGTANGMIFALGGAFNFTRNAAFTPPVQELTLTVVKDSFLRNGNPDRNEGANPRLRVRSSGKNRALVGFDLTAIDDFINSSGLTKATLTVTIAENANNWGKNNDRTVDAHPLLEDFAEGNGQNAGVPGSESTRGDGPGVTWKCAEDAEISNQATDCDPKWNGGNFGPSTADPQLHVNGQLGDVSWDVTDDVLAGASSWLIKKTAQGQNGKVLYYSREGADDAGDPALAPRLVLEN